MTNLSPSTSVMLELKERTREEHVSAEQHPLQQQLLRGSLPLPLYISHLQQFFLVHRALDSALGSLRSAKSEVRTLLQDWQFQTPYLMEDLASFGVDPEKCTPLPAAQALITKITDAQTESDFILLGFHYVLEGSNNGSRFIARRVRAAYDLTGNIGTRYLDPYGEEQAGRWQAFRIHFDALNFSLPERERIIHGAQFMFQSINRMATELLATIAQEAPAEKS